MYEKVSSDILSFFPPSLNEIFKLNSEVWNTAEEIRVRINQPLCIKRNDDEIFLNKKVGQEEIIRLLENFSNNSIYSVQSEINNGFLTLKGGHRVGISGTTVFEDEKIKNIKFISSLNIRIAREIKDCSKSIIHYIVNKNTFSNTLIISPPGCGKTTILRDMIRNLSNGFDSFKGNNIGLADERGEVAAVYKGVPQNDVGMRTDIMNDCLKYIGMNMLIRSMGPQIIATDEIGGTNDEDAINCAVNSGIKLLLTSHGASINDVPKKLIDNRVFSNIVVLTRKRKPGEIKNIYKLMEDKYVTVC